MTGINKLLLSAPRLHCKPTVQPSWLCAAPEAWWKGAAAQSAGTWLRGEKGVPLTPFGLFSRICLTNLSPSWLCALLGCTSLSPSWSIAMFFFPGKWGMHSCSEPEVFHSRVPSCLQLCSLCRYRHQEQIACCRWVYAVREGVGWHSLGIMYFYHGSLATQLAEWQVSWS